MVKLNYAKAARQYKAEHYGEQIGQKKARWSRAFKAEQKKAWKGKHPKAAKVRQYYAADSQDRKSERYWRWRKAVLKRDKYQCQDCQSRSAKLIAHHLKPWYDYPQYRFSVHNGKTLCEDCHIKIHPWINPGRYQELKSLIKTSKPRKIIRIKAV